MVGRYGPPEFGMAAAAAVVLGFVTAGAVAAVVAGGWWLLLLVLFGPFAAVLAYGLVVSLTGGAAVMRGDSMTDQTPTPEKDVPGVTGCNYGVHPFRFTRTFGNAVYNLHLHACPDCGAEYIRAGATGCRECVIPSGSDGGVS